MSHEPVRQEEDRIHSVRIILIGLTALVCFLIGIYWASRIQHDVVGDVRTPVGFKPGEVGHREVGMVYQSTFDGTEIAREHDAPLRAKLSTYGWADDAHQTMRIPIHRAMQLVVDKGAL